MGIVSTNNRIEASETGKIYLDKEFYKAIPNKLKPPRRCHYCRTPLTYDCNNCYYGKGFCDLWCYEIEHPPKIEHVCKTCGIVVLPYKKNTGASSGIYSKYCKECSPYGKKKNKNK